MGFFEIPPKKNISSILNLLNTEMKLQAIYKTSKNELDQLLFFRQKLHDVTDIHIQRFADFI